jgi:uncharacterized Zn finger protein
MARWHRRGPYYSDYYFPPSQPRPAEGGIKSRSRKGRFGESWWARRWIEVLEASPIGERLSRGRSYARGGQVTGIEVTTGKITAQVQGSRVKPYVVTIAVKTHTAKQWGRIADTLAADAMLTAKLLAGELPPAVEGVLADAGLPLFPVSAADLGTECSCPDWSNPCKHIAAVFYLLAEEIDRDAFLLLRLRGLSREDLVEMVAGSVGEADDGPAEPVMPPEPLPTDPGAFWGAPPPELDLKVDPATARGPAVLPHRLGPFPFWRGEEPFLEVMDGIYADAASEALELLADPVGEEDHDG